MMRRIVLAAAMLVSVVSATDSRAQSFEVASVKPAPAGRGGPSIVVSPGGTFTAANATLRRLIRWAYHVQDFQIAGGPDYYNQPTYELIAKAPSAASHEALAEMLQTLLADRFKLKLHRETKETQVYTLVSGNDGPKLKEMENGAEGPSRVRFTACGLELTFPGGASVSQLANFLSVQSWMDRPVIDRTGLRGIFSLKLQFSADGPVSLADQGFESGAAPPPPPPPSDAPCSRSTIFDAVQKQLGLKLEMQKASVDVMVIDHWEKPSEN